MGFLNRRIFGGKFTGIRIKILARIWFYLPYTAPELLQCITPSIYKVTEKQKRSFFVEQQRGARQASQVRRDKKLKATFYD